MKKIILGLFLILATLTFASPNFVDVTEPLTTNTLRVLESQGS